MTLGILALAGAVLGLAFVLAEILRADLRILGAIAADVRAFAEPSKLAFRNIVTNARPTAVPANANLAAKAA
jgi:hypothetical protein